MQPSKHPIDKYFEHITSFHYYMFFLLFVAKLPIFWHVLSFIFLSPPMTYVCKENNETEKCPCVDIEWDRSVFTETVQTKYGIYCENKWLITISQSTVYVGLLIGAMTLGYFSDRFGRLPAFSLSSLIIAVAGILASQMPSMMTFIGMRLIEGIGSGGAIVTGFVLLVEYCGTSYREVVSALYHVPINMGHMSLAGMSYVFRNCDALQIALSIPMFLIVTIYCLGQESPKWLLDNGEVAKATRVMETIMKFNHHPSDNIKAELQSYYAAHPTTKAAKIKVWQIFNYRKLTINFLCMAVIYFVCGMGYYGVSQYIGKMSGNIHLNVAISGGLLIPGSLMTAVLLPNLGRKTFLMATSFSSGISMLTVVFISEGSLVKVLIACLGNTLFFMSFIIVFLYGVELFPTAIRNSVLGCLSVLSRVGQICAPPINALSPTIAGVVFGVMAIVGGLLCLPLPETKDRELPSTLEDMNTRK